MLLSIVDEIAQQISMFAIKHINLSFMHDGNEQPILRRFLISDLQSQTMVGTPTHNCIHT